MAKKDQDRRPCPRCGEPIMRSATVCRFCQAAVEPMPAAKKGGVPWAGLVVLVIIIGAIAAFSNDDDGGSGSTATRRTPRPQPVDTTVRVTYKLTGTATGADLTYTDGSGNIQQQAGVAVPLKNNAGGDGISFTTESGEFVSFSAQNQGDSGDLECEIEADGRTINTGRASGAYTIVSCSGRLP